MLLFKVLHEAKKTTHTVSTFVEPYTDFNGPEPYTDFNGPLTATPIYTCTTESVEDLGILATIACNTQPLPVHHAYHVQCQTPATVSCIIELHVTDSTNCHSAIKTE